LKANHEVMDEFPNFIGEQVWNFADSQLTALYKHRGVGTFILSVTNALCSLSDGIYPVCFPLILTKIVPPQQLSLINPAAGKLVRWLQSEKEGTAAHFFDN